VKELLELVDENNRLREENDQLKKDKKEIQKEFDEYKARHPSHVGVKHGKPYVIKLPPAVDKPKKKPGARPEHKPAYRPRPEVIDNAIVVPVETCPDCGSDELSEKVQEVRTRTIEDIPVCQPVVNHYEIHRRYCRCCKKLVETPVHDALPNARIGVRTMLFVTWLKVGLRMTEEAIPQLLETTFNLRISEGEVQNILNLVAEGFRPFYDQMIKDMRARPARFMDETSWSINGENAWVWAFVSKWETIYHIARSRGHEVPLYILGANPVGVDVHDRFSAYDTLKQKTGNRPQQLCWWHILADAKEIQEQIPYDGGNHLMICLNDLIFQEACKLAPHGTLVDVEDLKVRMERYLVRPSFPKVYQTFVKNLLKRRDELFIFVTNPEVEGTNNRAERAMRPVVVNRKITGGSRTKRGATNYATLFSVLRTFQSRKMDWFQDGRRILNASCR